MSQVSAERRGDWAAMGTRFANKFNSKQLINLVRIMSVKCLKLDLKWKAT